MVLQSNLSGSPTDLYDTIASSVGGLEGYEDEEFDWDMSKTKGGLVFDDNEIDVDSGSDEEDDDDEDVISDDDNDSDDDYDLETELTSSAAISQELSTPFINMTISKHIAELSTPDNTRALLDPQWLIDRNDELLKSMLSLEGGKITEQVSNEEGEGQHEGWTQYKRHQQKVFQQSRQSGNFNIKIDGKFTTSMQDTILRNTVTAFPSKFRGQQVSFRRSLKNAAFLLFSQ
jgi:hypothetical protein